jgi:hypothetical protein
LSAPLKTLRHTQKKRCICFLVSDFIDDSLNLDELSLTKKYHDLIGVKINDPSEEALRIPAFYQAINPETKRTEWVNGFSAYVKSMFSSSFQAHQDLVKQALETRGISLITLSTEGSIAAPLAHFFNKRK